MSEIEEKIIRLEKQIEKQKEKQKEYYNSNKSDLLLKAKEKYRIDHPKSKANPVGRKKGSTKEKLKLNPDKKLGRPQGSLGKIKV